LEITLQEIDEHLYHVHGLRVAESRYGGSSTATPQLSKTTRTPASSKGLT
jgi:hypothetical protein